MKRLNMLGIARWCALGVVAATAAACGGRDAAWELSTSGTTAFGLTDAVAVWDPAADRVLLMTTDAERHLTVKTVPTQRGARTAMVSPDRSKLFVVSAGDGDNRPPPGKDPQEAALEIVTRAAGTRRYPLSEPLAGLALDPRGRWAVLYADETSRSLVRNPNELLLVDLTNAAAAGTNPRPHTLRSFGGQPQRFTFTDELNLPGSRRRLLIVETEQDVAIIDLLHPEAPEITIQLTAGQDTRRLQPAGVVVSEGDAAVLDDARIAIRLANDSTMVLAQLVPGDGSDFRPELNLTDVGGVPSDAAFVRTDGGALALAVLVPSRGKAVVVDPRTGVTQDVALPAPYQRLSVVTGQSGAGGVTTPSPVDVALLWGGAGGDGGVAFWELGRTSGQPYRSVETVGVTTGVTSVVDVDGLHPELKILGTSAARFFLLDLRTRTSAPFSTSSPGVQLMPSIMGDRAWAYLPGTAELSVVDLESLHPEALKIDRGISAVFEIAAVEPASGQPPMGARSLVVWHETGNMGVTVYDARPGDAAARIDERRNYAGILTEGLHAKAR